MKIEIRHLQLVLAVEEEGSLARASGRLHVSPSALSHQLRQLEQRVGQKVFDRSGKRLVLNRAGRSLLETAREVLPRIEATESDLARAVHGRPRTVSISTECYTCYHWLPRALPRLRRALGIEVRIRVEHTRAPLEALLAGALDIAIVSAPRPERQSLAWEPILRDELVVVVAPGHPLARRKQLSARDLETQVVLVYDEDPAVSSLLGEVLAPAGVTPARVLAVPLTEAIIELVEAGEGVALLARWAVQSRLDTGSLVGLSVAPRGFHRQWSAASLAGSPIAAMLPDVARLAAAGLSR